MYKIVGGGVALPGEFPFNIGIYDTSQRGVPLNNSIVCGGVILTTTLVLTAAHCLDGKRPSNFRVVAGQNDLNKESGFEQVRTPKWFHFHEKFTRLTNGSSNDLGIIFLSEPFQFTKYVHAVSLPKPNEEFNGWLTLLGFGYMSERSPKNTNKLRKVRVPIIPRVECQRSYYLRSGVISDQMLCAGEEGRDSCKGDSGGPAICYRTVNDPVLCGIVSWGYGCAKDGYPGINMKVSHYIDWLEQAEKTVAVRGKCKTSEFYCSSSNKCIPREEICNGRHDCDGGEDELSCTVSVGRCFSDWKCLNGKCIVSRYLCDGDNDCRDHSDEWKCPAKTWDCEDNEFQCGFGGRCIPTSWKCDGITDCDNSMDEIGCNLGNNSIVKLETNNCPKDKFHCPDNFVFNQCIPRTWLCDGQADCSGAHDEQNCPGGSAAMVKETGQNFSGSPCSPEEFHCPGNIMYSDCIPKHWLCDGETDCTGRSDEINCRGTLFQPTTVRGIINILPTLPPTCPPGTFSCYSGGRCYPNYYRCDNDVDCFDGSDEKGCNYTTTTTTTTEASSSCRATEFPCETTGTCFPLSYRCDRDRDCNDGSDENNCWWHQLNATQTECGINEFLCDDFQGIGGDCQPNSFRCDDDDDCTDGTDEMNCTEVTTTTTRPTISTTSRCYDFYFECENGGCIFQESLCNGIDDCGDGSDEIGCDRRNGTGFILSRQACPGDYFPCRFYYSLRVCIAKELKCNGDYDCPGGLDERNCTNGSRSSQSR